MTKGERLYKDMKALRLRLYKEERQDMKALGKIETRSRGWTWTWIKREQH